MTEKTLLVENPFALETNSKKLVQRLEEQQPQERVADMTIEERLYSKTKISRKFGIIRALDEEAEKMAKAREETLARDAKRLKEMSKSRTAPLWASTSTSQDMDIKKQITRINNVLKEKRETISEFVAKKREICLSNMNIFNKREETERLEDFIKNEKESLKARKYYFENDWTMVNQFIKEVEGDATDAQKEAERQQREKERNKEKLNQLTAEVERIEQKIARQTEEYDNLLRYKSFIDKIKDKYQEVYGDNDNYLEEKRKKAKAAKALIEKETLYLTQPSQAGGVNTPRGGGGVNTPRAGTNKNIPASQALQQAQQEEILTSKYVIPFTPSQLRDILNHIQEKNLYYCQNNNESEEVYENKKKEKNMLEETLEKKKKESEDRIRELEKQRDVQMRRKQNLVSLKQFNVSKVQISEGEDMDMQKIGEKIFSIIKDIEENENRPGGKQTLEANQMNEVYNNLVVNLDSKEMRKQMHQIEKKLESICLWRDELLSNEESAKKIAETEKLIKLAKSREKQSEQQKRTVKNLDEKLKERENNLQNRRKGRPIMGRSLLQKPIVAKVEQNNDDVDYDLKYFSDDFDFANHVLENNDANNNNNNNNNSIQNNMAASSIQLNRQQQQQQKNQQPTSTQTIAGIKNNLSALSKTKS